METFGSNLKLIRQSSHLSQKKLAELMHIPQQRISEWECDKVEPTLRNLIKLTKILDTAFEELTEGMEQGI